MAIRFTPEYNKRINRIVSNYNQKVNRANKRGKINRSELPETVSARLLKKSYSNRSDLERELKNLESFSRKSVRRQDGVLSEYDVKIINQNRLAAIKHYEHEADIIREKANSNYPLQKERLNAIEANLKILKKGVSNANTEELVSMERYIDKYRKSFERRSTGYRGFLSEVEELMKMQKIDKAQRDAFFDKLSQLNEQEFFELYEKNDLISKIYQLADSPKVTGGKLIIHAKDEKEPEKLIQTLLTDIDKLIAEIKNK